MKSTIHEIQKLLTQHTHVIGSDECGFGSWAGPMYCCAALTVTGWSNPAVRDSKQLSPAARERLHGSLLKTGLLYEIESIPAHQIDEMGAGKALRHAHENAISRLLDKAKALGWATPLVIVDGSNSYMGGYALPKADALIPTVGAASIVGKVEHDREMVLLDAQYPGYGLAQHMGYGTKQHSEALKRLGVTPIHRKSYAPIRDLLGSV